MIKEINILKILKIGVILTLLYFLIFLLSTFVFSDKLSREELIAVTDIYEEMIPVNNDIKSDFYVDTLLKVLDKQYILNELRKDSVIYSMSVSERALSMYQSSLDGDKVYQYLTRCHLDFDKFVGLEATSDIFELNESFFLNSSTNVEDLNTFGNLLAEILYYENQFLKELENSKIIIISSVIISYIVLFVILYFVKFNNLIDNINGLKKKYIEKKVDEK